MALVLKDRVKETTTTAGTGTVTLAGATAGFQSFAAVGNGNQTFYAIVDSATGDWEVGVGTYTASGTTLSRTTVVSSSNAGSLVSFGSGAKDVFVTYPSSRSVYLDAAGSAVTTLDIGTLGVSTANISTANITAGTVANAPVNNTDIVNKQYADAIASGIHFHEAVNLATTAALPANTYNNGTSGVGATLTGNANGALSVDSTLTTASERILVKNEAAGANNGVYTVTQVGSAGTPYILTRATDFDSVGTGVNEIDEGDFFLVTSGTANVNTAWVQQTPPPITIGTTALVFQQFSAPITYTAGTGLNESPTYTFNIANTTVTAATYGSASAVPVFAVNAQGQLTSVTNTAIAINGSAVTGAISGQAGSVANALTLGTYLTGGSFNGSAAVTATVDATSANTASKVVARDASGDFSAGTITATLSGSSTSATTATNLAGGTLYQIPYQTAAGTTSFITAASGTNTVLNFNGSAFSWSAGTISGVPLGSNLNSLTAGTYLTGTAYNGSAAQTWTVDATDANTASKVVARDASGDFSAGTITAALTGNALTATTATNQSGGTVSATTGAFSGLLTVQQNSTTAVQIASGYYIGMGDWGMRNTTPNGYIQFGPANSSYAHIYTDRPNFYFNQDILVNGNLVLTSANYNSYAPTLTGTGASGTWGINVTGSAGSTSGNAATASRVTGGNLNPASTAFNNALISASSSNRVVTFDGNGSTPSVWWSNGSRAYGAIDAIDPGLAFWANNGTSWQQQMQVNYGNVTINTDIRSPIFYDSSDTGFYIDPASTSDTALRMRGGALFGPNTTWGAYLAVGGNGWYGSGSYASVAATDGNLHIDAATGKDIYLNYYAGSNVRAYSSFIAINNVSSPIYYDYSNSAYYGDFAGTSQFNAATFAGYIGLGGNTPSTNMSGTSGVSIYNANYPSVGFSTAAGPNYLIYRLGSGGPLTVWNSTGSETVYFYTTYTQFTGSARAPLFYDSDNTGYYGDFASLSNLYTLQLTGPTNNYLYINPGNGYEAMVRYNGGSGSGWYVGKRLTSQVVGTADFHFYSEATAQTVLGVDTSGNLTAIGNVTAYSDERLKTDWEVLPANFVEKLAKVRSGTYTRIDSGERQAGVGAQSFQTLLPETVLESNDGTLSLAYGNAALASSVELAKYVTALEQRISQLEARL